MSLDAKHYAIAMLTASLAGDITADDQLRRNVFPGHFEDHYGWVEIFSSCVSLAEAMVDLLIETHGTMDDFWDEWCGDGRYRRPGVFEYDASMALLSAAAKRGGDVTVYFADVARDAYQLLLGENSPVAADSLPAHIQQILTA